MVHEWWNLELKMALGAKFMFESGYWDAYMLYLGWASGQVGEGAVCYFYVFERDLSLVGQLLLKQW